MVSWWKRLLSPTVEMLEAKVESQRLRIIAAEERYCAIAKECEKQRILISALRDVNASLDERCNDLERGR